MQNRVKKLANEQAELERRLKLQQPAPAPEGVIKSKSQKMLTMRAVNEEVMRLF